jgi:hypothetical protein
VLSVAGSGSGWDADYTCDWDDGQQMWIASGTLADGYSWDISYQADSEAEGGAWNATLYDEEEHMVDSAQVLLNPDGTAYSTSGSIDGGVTTAAVSAQPDDFDFRYVLQVTNGALADSGYSDIDISGNFEVVWNGSAWVGSGTKNGATWTASFDVDGTSKSADGFPTVSGEIDFTTPHSHTGHIEAGWAMIPDFDFDYEAAAPASQLSRRVVECDGNAASIPNVPEGGIGGSEGGSATFYQLYNIILDRFVATHKGANYFTFNGIKADQSGFSGSYTGNGMSWSTGTYTNFYPNGMPFSSSPPSISLTNITGVPSSKFMILLEVSNANGTGTVTVAGVTKTPPYSVSTQLVPFFVTVPVSGGNASFNVSASNGSNIEGVVKFLSGWSGK